MFNFSMDAFESSIGLIDFAFDVEYDIVSDETGTEYDWYADGPVSVTLWGDDGEIEAEMEYDPNNPVAQEILKHYNRHIVDLCHDDYSASW